MEKKEIEHLATLARIELRGTDAEELAHDITGILGYISEINDITGTVESEKKVGALFNVMREDTGAHEPGLYTEDILNAAPKRRDQYIEVKKILGNGS